MSRVCPASAINRARARVIGLGSSWARLEVKWAQRIDGFIQDRDALKQHFIRSCKLEAIYWFSYQLQLKKYFLERRDWLTYIR